ncbi:alpha/beta fold hydrolase BchO [Oceaniglobus roseus]|uniref:alpha/beta fold hydrolase BchO n=1 Tax=Oceaniglobus roseus TaxID=1737570 RepID=UPI000C7F48CD|nr:alpha/beta fold hydrolase BchO [Kandeliimicrobium roseum]
MDWTRHGREWPNRGASRFIPCRPHRWHVQEAGEGPTILLLHGAGGATQSWRGVFPILARDHHVIAPDLPGQGFTRLGTRSRSGLAATAEDLWTLCDDQGWRPDLIAGHSAGGAVALQMALERPVSGVMGINAALGTFDGLAGFLFPAMAKLLAATPFVPSLFARMSGNEARVKELLASTGSDIGPEGVHLYRLLTGDPGHVDGTLLMMSQWRIEPLLDALPRIACPVRLLATGNDRTVPPRVSREAAARLPRGEYVELPGLGHLAHEEQPARLAGMIADFLKDVPAGT